MLDNTKFLTTDLQIINRMLLHPDFVGCKPKNNYYHSLMHKDFGIKLSLDFRKAVENGEVVGYGHLEINISPHYHFNQYRHNGNDLTPENCIKSVSDILIYLGIKAEELKALKVCNLEFGLNIIPETDIKKLINGFLYYKKTPFKIGDFPYFKKTDATTYKFLKAYAKGLQFTDFPEYGINPNTLRFEIKTKQRKNIKTYGIHNANDLLKLETYNRLGETILKEWEQILIINSEPNLKGLKPDEVRFISNCKKVGFWEYVREEMSRNSWRENKERYYKIVPKNDNLHREIKTKIIEKFGTFFDCAFSTQKTTINRTKV